MRNLNSDQTGRGFLVVWWSRICLPVQEMWVRFPIQEDLTVLGAREPRPLTLCSRVQEPQLLIPCAPTIEAPAPQSLCSAIKEGTAAREKSVP